MHDGARSLALALVLALTTPLGGTAAAQEASPAAGEQLIVGTKVAKPFAFKTKGGTWTGISIDLWQSIQEKLGYTCVWKEAHNTDELVRMVAAGEVHVGIAAITMKPSRLELADFSHSFFKSGVGIAVRAKKAGILGMVGRFASTQLLVPLLSLCGLLFAMGSLVWLFERRANPEQFEPRPSGLWSGFWWSAVTMTTVGYGDKAPITIGGRTVSLVWMFGSIMITSFFTAAIASSLTTEQLTSAVRGESDLYRVQVGAKRGESPAAMLRNRGIVPVEFGSIEAGLEALAAGEIQAFVHDTAVIDYQIRNSDRFRPLLAVLHRPLRTEDYGIAVTKPADPMRRNVLVDRINSALLELKISGAYDTIVTAYLGK